MYCHCLLFISIWPFSNCQLLRLQSSIQLTPSSLKIRGKVFLIAFKDPFVSVKVPLELTILYFKILIYLCIYV